MQYNATSQRQIILPLAFLVLGLTGVTLLTLMIFTLCCLFAFVKYTLLINNHTIIYTIELFGLKIYCKEVKPSNIQQINFKRVGWKTKLAVIKVHQGLPIRVMLFEPKNVYDDLLIFCEVNTIQYEKTKDYQAT